MGENLLESYNPLYDVHLRQYFALPHMQKHLRNLGLLDGSPVQQQNELHAGHLAMMDLMLRNRERVLQQLMDLQRKLDAAEKVELYRRIRSGITNADEADTRHQHMSRSLSRPARSAVARFGERRGRRQSMSPEASELIKRVESDYRSDSAPFKNPKSIYNRLAASIYKYQYLHKLDDRTLRKYMLSLRKQLAKLERFREVSFGPHTMAKHPPQQLQQSWFFRRRSLPSLNSANANQSRTHTQHTNAGGQRSLKSGLSHKTRSGKSQSPLKFANAADEPPHKMQRRTSSSRTRQHLPPLPKKRSFAASRTNTLPTSKTAERLPPTSGLKIVRKTPPDPRRAPPPSTAQKKTPMGSRPVSKESTSPVIDQKRPSVSSVGGILPAISGAVAAVCTVPMVLEDKGKRAEEEEAEGRQSAAPSPSISLAASQTTTTDGGQAGVDSEWEDQRKSSAKTEAAPGATNGGTETRPTPELFLEQEEKENEPEESMEAEEQAQEQHTTSAPVEEEDVTREEQRMDIFQRESAPSPEERQEQSRMQEDNVFVRQPLQEHPMEGTDEVPNPLILIHPEFEDRSLDHHEESVEEALARSLDQQREGSEEADAPLLGHYEEHTEEADNIKAPGHHGEYVQQDAQSLNHYEDYVEEADVRSHDHHEERVEEADVKSPDYQELVKEADTWSLDKREKNVVEADAQSLDHQEGSVEEDDAKLPDHHGEFVQEADVKSPDYHEERVEEADARSLDHYEGSVEEADARSLDHHEKRVEEAYARSLDHQEGSVEENDAKLPDHHGEFVQEADVKLPDYHEESVEEADARSLDHHEERVEEADARSLDHHEERVEEAYARSLDHQEGSVEEDDAKLPDHHGEFVQEADVKSPDYHEESVEEADARSLDHHEERVEEADARSLDHHEERVEEADARSLDHHEERVEEADARSFDQENVEADTKSRDYQGHVDEADSKSPDHQEGSVEEVDAKSAISSIHSEENIEKNEINHKDNNERSRDWTDLNELEQSDFLIENRSVGEEEKRFVQEKIEYNGSIKGGQSLDEEQCPPEGCRLYRDDLVESEEVLRNENDLARKLSKTKEEWSTEGNWSDGTKGDKHLPEEDQHIEKGRESGLSAGRHSAEDESVDSLGKREEEGTTNYYGKPTWEGREEAEEAEDNGNGQTNGEEQRDESARGQSQHSRENGGAGGAELEQQIEPEEKVAMDDKTSQKSHHSSAINGISPTQSDNGTRPATAEAICQDFDEPIPGTNKLTTQPSIQITSASEYGGSVEGNMDSPKMHSPNKATGEDNGHSLAGEGTDKQSFFGNGDEEKAKHNQFEEETNLSSAESEGQKQTEGEGTNGERKANRTELGRKSNGHIPPTEEGALSDESEESDGSVIICNQKPKLEEERAQQQIELGANSEGK